MTLVTCTHFSRERQNGPLICWNSPTLAFSVVGAFIEEPFNVTVAEGESIKFNCSMGVISEDIATWVINGLEYYWSDFLIIEVYTFDLQDNSLAIHNSPRSLDGNSYQCILDNQRSRIGYLSVLYMSPTPSSRANSSSDYYSSTGRLILCSTSKEKKAL